MSYPRTSGLPLSEVRVAQFREEAVGTFEHNCIARLILTKVNVDATLQGDFRKIGINHIVDRIWFVDNPPGDMAFGTPSGSQYGMAVAETESRLVLEKLFELAHESEYVTDVGEHPEENDIIRFLADMERRARPTLILSSLALSSRFWDFRAFAPAHTTRRGLTSPEGTYLGIPVFHSRLLPDGVILAANKQELGNLEVKTDFAISVSDITDAADRESIRRGLPNLAGTDLSEKVRILCYETVRATLSAAPAAAFAVLKSSDSELTLKTFTD